MICASFTTLVTLGSSWAMAKRLVCIDLAVVKAVKPVRIICSDLIVAVGTMVDSSLKATPKFAPATLRWIFSLTLLTFSKFLSRKQRCSCAKQRCWCDIGFTWASSWRALVGVLPSCRRTVATFFRSRPRFSPTPETDEAQLDVDWLPCGFGSDLGSGFATRPLILWLRPPMTPRQSDAPHRQVCPSWGLKREKL